MLKITSKRVGSYSRVLKRLTAAGLSRVLDHMWKGPFGILSAAMVKDRDENLVSDEENYKRTGNLKNLLKQQGYGFIDLQGSYLYEVEDGEPKVPVKEDSVFIPNISEIAVKELASQFNQESYIFGEGGGWSLKETESGATWEEGSVADTFEALRHKEVGEDHPFMSQIGTDRGHQFRLDTDLVERRREKQDQLSRDQHEQQSRVAFRLVGGSAPCFYSIAGHFRPRPPVCIAESDISLSGNCPGGSLLECWLPLQKIS